MKFSEIVKEINKFEIVARKEWPKGEIVFKMAEVTISEKEMVMIQKEIGDCHKGFEYLVSLDLPIRIGDGLVKLEDKTVTLGWFPTNEDLDAEDWFVIE